MSTARSEYCQFTQDAYPEFVAAYYRHRGRVPPEQRLQAPYPRRRHPRPDFEHVRGWRIVAYTLDGHLERIFPWDIRPRPAYVNGTPVLQPRLTPDNRPTPDLRYWPLTSDVVAATCDHECWPMPNVFCGCGIFASPTAQALAHIVRLALKNASRGGHLTFTPRRQLLAHRADLWDVHRTPATRQEPAEYRAGRLQICGPLLATSERATRDLRARGFDVVHAVDDPHDLPTYLDELDDEDLTKGVLERHTLDRKEK